MDRERKRYPEANVWPENRRLVSQRTADVWWEGDSLSGDNKATQSRAE